MVARPRDVRYTLRRLVAWRKYHRPPCRSRAMHVPRDLHPIERTLAERLPHGTRVEDAHERGLPPARLRAPPAPRVRTRPRRIGLMRLGIQWLRHLLAHG